MNIPKRLINIKEKIEEPAVYFSLVIVLVALVSFGLGRLSALEENRVPVKITGGVMQEAVVSAAAAKTVPKAQGEVGEVFASVNGTKYYYSHCGGLSRINKENLISFLSAADAETAGYSIAANCTAR